MDNLVWWKARRIDGMRMQNGIVVLRPDFAAFLPTEASYNLLTGIVKAAGGVVTLRGSSPNYDLEGLRARGHLAFDEAVRAMATASGELWTPENAEVVGTKQVALRRGKVHWVLKHPPTPEVLAPWPRGVVESGTKDLAKVFAVISVISAFIALVTGIIATAYDSPDVIWGVGFWLVLAIAPWIVFLVVIVRKRG